MTRMCRLESFSTSSIVSSSTLVARAMSVRVTMPTSLFPSTIGSYFVLFLNIRLVASGISMSDVPVMMWLLIASKT
jgi:hypothetical protein